jgi:hypothetical protein
MLFRLGRFDASATSSGEAPTDAQQQAPNKTSKRTRVMVSYKAA